eukprot:COSAG06_NODE_2247_length_7259_cov_24.660506_4_plen_161_part_00
MLYQDAAQTAASKPFAPLSVGWWDSTRDPQNGFQPRPGCGTHATNVDIWPAELGGDVNTDPMGRRVNIACCKKYDAALARLGTIDIYDITDQDCSPGALTMGSKDKSETILSKIDLLTASRSKSSDRLGSDTLTPKREPLRDLDPCGGIFFCKRSLCSFD